MLSQEATAMAGLSGNNLGTILTLIVDLVSVIIVAYISPCGLANETVSHSHGNSGLSPSH